MVRYLTRSILLSLAGLMLVSSAHAQQVVIQQPVVSQFGIDTVVSVPDGGRVLLGAVGGARDARFQSGFSPIGSSLGMERFHQSADVSVFIHDLDEMDRAILASGTTMENPWTGEITHDAVSQGAGIARTYSHRPAGPVTEPGAPAGEFDPRGTAAFAPCGHAFVSEFAAQPRGSAKRLVLGDGCPSARLRFQSSSIQVVSSWIDSVTGYPN